MVTVYLQKNQIEILELKNVIEIKNRSDSILDTATERTNKLENEYEKLGR